LLEECIVFIGETNEHLELQALERVPDHLPTSGDVRLRAVLKLGKFRGEYDQVWIEHAALRRFVRDLEALLETRAGSAELRSMSPGELTLVLSPTDTLGHVGAEVRLGRKTYSGHVRRETHLEGGFDVEAGQIGTVLTGAKKLLSSVVPR
jgi:hypothetical protein